MNYAIEWALAIERLFYGNRVKLLDYVLKGNTADEGNEIEKKKLLELYVKMFNKIHGL